MSSVTVESFNSSSPVYDRDGWRTRNVIQELRACSTTAGLVSYEQDLRFTLTQRESRARIKLIARSHRAECGLAERLDVVEQESRERRRLVAAWATEAFRCGAVFSTIKNEAAERDVLLKEEQAAASTLAEGCECAAVVIQEAHERLILVDLNVLVHRELRGRFHIQLDQEVRWQLLKESYTPLILWGAEHCANAAESTAALRRDEEQARQLVESEWQTSFQKTCLDEVAERVGLTRCALLPGVLAHEEAAREALLTCVRSEQRVLRDEDALRRAVAQEEEEVWNQIQRAFVLGWRGVHQQICAFKHAMTAVLHLEQLERRLLQDQSRCGFRALSAQFTHGHTAITQQEAALHRLAQAYLDGVSSIWQEEHSSFVALHRHKHHTLREVESLEAALVCQLEETHARRRVCSDEARLRVCFEAEWLQLQCISCAVRGAQHIMQEEAQRRDALVSMFVDQVIIAPQGHLYRAEYLSRLQLESEEQQAAVHVLAEYCAQRCLPGREAVLACSAAQEAEWRRRLTTEESTMRQDLYLREVQLAEHSMRRTLVRHERYYLATLGLRMVEDGEDGQRHSIESALRGGFDHFKRIQVEEEEDKERSSVECSERERRTFLLCSVPYQQLPLRSCEVDELDGRLRIVAEAEMTIRACALRCGHDQPVRYCSEDLWQQEAQRHFLSLKELAAERANRFVALVEPERRRDVEAEQEALYQLLRALEKEASARLRLEELETKSRAALYTLQHRLVNRQRSFEQP